MKIKRIASLFLFLLIPVALAGCGSDSGTNQFQLPTSSLEKAQPCIDCHYANVSPGTGKIIPEEYKMSGHAAKNGAACPDCHAPSANHPLTCAGCHGGSVFDIEADLTRNPDEAGKCLNCHGVNASRAPLIQGRFASEKLFNHYTTSARRGAFITSQNVGKCRSCHNPHNNTLIPQFREWAESGHGNPDPMSALVRSDFKIRGSNREPKDLPNNAYGFSTIYTSPTTTVSFCVRCHTSTGFIRYVSSGFKNISAWGNNAKEWGRQVMYCNTCHYSDQNGRSYNYTVRIPPPAKGFYNYTSKGSGKILYSVQYPNLNQSNNCMNCHVGWHSGPELKLMAKNAVQNGYTSYFKERTGTAAGNTINGFLNTHYFTAGATLFKSIGYEFADRNYDDPVEFKHKEIGMENYRETTTKGPCVMCHIFPGRMTFLPVERVAYPFSTSSNPAIPPKQTGTITEIKSPTCAKCHDGSFRPAWTPELLTEKKEGFQAALDALLAQLTLRKGMYFYNGNPYFFKSLATGDPTTRTAAKYFKDWGTVDVLGAALNFNYLWHDFGAFAHNSRYTKRLIYDSIDYMDDYQLNYSVGKTLDDLSPAPVYRDKAKAYLLNGPTTNDTNERL